MTYTHTYALLAVSKAAYDEIAERLRKAGYDHVFDMDSDAGTVIDMHGIALSVEAEPKTTSKYVPQFCDFCGAGPNVVTNTCSPPFEVRPHQWTGAHPADKRIMQALETRPEG